MKRQNKVSKFISSLSPDAFRAREALHQGSRRGYSFIESVWVHRLKRIQFVYKAKDNTPYKEVIGDSVCL